MKILKFHRKPKLMHYKYEQHKTQGDEVVDLKSPEAPLVDVDRVFNGIPPEEIKKGQEQPPNLVDVIISVKELPLHYAKSIRVTGFDVSHTASGTRSMRIYYTKAYKIGKAEKEKTPLFQFDEPAEGEKEESAVTGDERTACNRAIMEAERYIAGERQSQTLSGIKHGTIEDENQKSMFEDGEGFDPSGPVKPSGGAASVKNVKPKRMSTPSKN
jgi:hypothetical protein